MTTNHLLLGTVDAAGHVESRPIIASVRPDGTVASWHPLDGHEPPSTTLLRALLHLPTGTMRLL